MQSVNDDMDDLSRRMDDLFRQAADEYPLHTEGADWSKVLKGLEAGAGKQASQNTPEYKSFFWVAAIFLLVICTTYIRRTETGEKAAATAGTQPAQNSKDNIQDKTTGLVHNRKPFIASGSLVRKQGPFLIPTIERLLQEQHIDQEPPAIAVQELTPVNELLPGRDSTRLAAPEVIKKEMAPVADLSKDEKKKSQLRSAKKLYLTLVAGPDISTVKSQKVSNTGYTAGLLAGYRFSKKMSLETGILWDRKDYYSIGKYFNKDALGLAQHAKVIDVEGYCNMFEIPVNLKFDWMVKKKYNLFATTGISSYLMKREKYDYEYDYYGTRYKYYKKYEHASRNWTSILNLSVGYERRLGKAGFLRIEPYMKLPLKGVGVGEMPIGSKGVLFGFTRPIH